MKSREKEENLGVKLRKRVLVVRGGQQTPVTTQSWRLKECFSAPHDNNNNSSNNNNNNSNNKESSVYLFSARKLAAALWDLHQRHVTASEMHRGDPRRLRHVAPHDPSPSSPDFPDSASGLRRHVITSLKQQYHRSTERNNHHTFQPASPASYGSSSMEVVQYNAAVTPSSSIDFKGTNHGLKTSTELIKVLNRIWALEEQHSSNMSLVKALKKELDHSRMRIKELVKDRKTDRHEIEDLKIQVFEHRKIKDQEKISSTIQSIRDELEDERKLRKRSEGLHRKLARELYEVKISLSNTSKEVEREGNSRRLLEDLCDEFAMGIRSYEQEIQKLRQKYEKDLVGKFSRDRLILHVSESWLDERMQMKLGEKTKMTSVVEKLSSEIESFLRAKRENSFVVKGNLVQKSPNFRRSSLESIPLNTAISAPQHVSDDEDSDVSESYCFELNKPSSSGLKTHPEDQNIIGLKNETAKKHNNNNTELNIEKGKSEISEIIEEQNDEEAVNGVVDKKNALETNHLMDELIRSQYCHDSNFVESQWGRNASPVRQWTPKLSSQDRERGISESPITKLPLDLRENTLKAKLIEARSRGQRSRSRLKGSKILF